MAGRTDEAHIRDALDDVGILLRWLGDFAHERHPDHPDLAEGGFFWETLDRMGFKIAAIRAPGNKARAAREAG